MSVCGSRIYLYSYIYIYTMNDITLRWWCAFVFVIYAFILENACDSHICFFCITSNVAQIVCVFVRPTKARAWARVEPKIFESFLRIKYPLVCRTFCVACVRARVLLLRFDVLIPAEYIRIYILIRTTCNSFYIYFIIYTLWPCTMRYIYNIFAIFLWYAAPPPRRTALRKMENIYENLYLNTCKQYKLICTQSVTNDIIHLLFVERKTRIYKLQYLLF